MRSHLDGRGARRDRLRAAALVIALGSWGAASGCAWITRCADGPVPVTPLPLAPEQRDELDAYCDARCPADAERERVFCDVWVPLDGEATLTCSFVPKDPNAPLSAQRSGTKEAMTALPSGLGARPHCLASCPEAPEAPGKATGCAIRAEGLECTRVKQVCAGG